jgi:drug/metabolite transporter (DMT)-like permease
MSSPDHSPKAIRQFAFLVATILVCLAVGPLAYCEPNLTMSFARGMRTSSIMGGAAYAAFPISGSKQSWRKQVGMLIFLAGCWWAIIAYGSLAHSETLSPVAKTLGGVFPFVVGALAAGMLAGLCSLFAARVEDAEPEAPAVD